MAFLISCQAVGKAFGARPLFEALTLGVDEGERIGLIGPNGSGKSTLLKLFAGREKPDSGAVSARRLLRLEYVGQQDELPEAGTVEDALKAMLAGDTDDEFSQARRIDSVLELCGFSDPLEQVAQLSQGRKKRLAIGRALVRNPQVTLLDEPTNHLDLDGILWLEGLLRTASFAFVLITHDRAFLQAVSNRVVELHPAYPEGYLSVRGNYAEFLEAREAFLQAQQALQQSLASKARRELEWLRQGAPARSTKEGARIRSAHQSFADLAEVKFRNSQERIVALKFDATDRRARALVAAVGLTVQVEARTLFKNFDLTLASGDRLGLLGPSSSGKTTLLNLLAGDSSPSAGTVRRAEGLQVAYFRQNRGGLPPQMTLADALSPAGGDTVIFHDRPYHIAGWAKRFLFRPEQLPGPISVLSGGEMARVHLSRLMLRPADLLLLDEPANDLDLPTLEVLEECLQSFGGAVVLCTQDRSLLDNVCSEILALDGLGGARFFADTSQWERWKSSRPAVAIAAPPPGKPREQKPIQARMSQSELRELARIEGKIEAAEAQVALLQEQLHDPGVASDGERAHQAWLAVQEAEEKAAALYSRWEELEALKASLAGAEI